jgi:hypothetical protein
VNNARLNEITNEENMSEEKKLVPLRVVVDAATLDTETGHVEVVPGLEKVLVEQLVKELGTLQAKIKTLEEKPKETTEEKDKGEQL